MKKIAALLVVVLTLLLTACGGNTVESEPASVDLMEQVQLTENEMKGSLVELARRMENQMRVSDPNAKARFYVDENGRCSILVTESGEDGVVYEDTEISAADTVQDFFALYLEYGFLDAQGNVAGFPDEVPEDKLAKLQENSETPTPDMILENTPLEGASNEVAGFPGEGMIEAKAPESKSASESEVVDDIIGE